MNLRASELVILVLVSLIPALVPIVVAYARQITHRRAVLWVALLTSWTFVGWIVAMVLSIVGSKQPEPQA